MIVEMRVNPTTIAIIVRLYAIFLSEEKVNQWLRTRNLKLGGASPLMLINRGMAEKVFEFIREAQSLNELGNTE